MKLPSPLDQLTALGRDEHRVDGLQPDELRPVRFGGRGPFLGPDQLREADGVFLVELDEPVETGRVALHQPVGVLPDDEVALLQAHDALGLDSECPDPEVGPRLEQRLPDVEAIRRRNVDLVGEFASEADSPHEAFDPGHGSRRTFIYGNASGERSIPVTNRGGGSRETARRRSWRRTRRSPG